MRRIRSLILCRSGWIVPLGFGLLAFLTRSRHPTFDAWRYSLQIEGAIRLGKGLAQPDLWHPHHIGYLPLGYLVVRACRLIAGPLPALLVLQALSAICAAGCLAALAQVLGSARADRSGPAGPGPGDGIALLPLAFSFAFWYFAGEAEVYLPALCFASTGVATLVRAPGGRARVPLAAALLIAATLMHQMMVLLLLPLAAWWWSARPASWRQGLGILLLWGSGALLAYWLVWWLVARHGGAGSQDFPVWVAYYLHSGLRQQQAWGHVDAGTPLRAALGLARAVFGGHAVLALDPEIVEPLRRLVPGAFILHEVRVMEATPRIAAWASLLCSLVSAATWAGGLTAALRRRARTALGPDARHIGRLGALWAATIAGFVLWWEADNPEFWLLAFPGVVLWLAVLTRGRWNRATFSLGLATLVAAVALGSLAPKALGPRAHELSLFARAARLSAERGGGRVWPGFGGAFLPDPALAPLWARVPAAGALDSLKSDIRARRARVWILPDSVAARDLAGGAVRMDGAGTWGVWRLTADGPSARSAARGPAGPGETDRGGSPPRLLSPPPATPSQRMKSAKPAHAAATAGAASGSPSASPGSATRIRGPDCRLRTPLPSPAEL